MNLFGKPDEFIELELSYTVGQARQRAFTVWILLSMFICIYLEINFPSNFYYNALKVNAVQSFSYPQKNYIFNFYHLPQATVNCILKLPTSVHHNGKKIPRTGSRETHIKKKLNYRVNDKKTQ